MLANGAPPLPDARTSPGLPGEVHGIARMGTMQDFELRLAGVPLPRPLPVRSSRRGENSIVLRTVRAASAGAPSGSPRLATSPKTAGGGWVGGWDPGSATRFELRPPGAPPPAPPRSFLTERGEFNRAADSLWVASPSPAQFAGRAGEGGGPPSRHHAVRTTSGPCSLSRFRERVRALSERVRAPADAARSQITAHSRNSPTNALTH